MEEEELTLVDLDQKEEKKVEEEGVEEEVVVAWERVGERTLDDPSGPVFFVADEGWPCVNLFTADTEASNPFEEETEISENCDGLREIALEAFACACAGVEVVIDTSCVDSAFALVSPCANASTSSLTLPRPLLPVAWLVTLACLSLLPCFAMPLV